MSIEDYSIQLKIDVESDEQRALVETFLRMKAREILSGTLLVCNRRRPQVCIVGHNSFESEREISMLTDLEPTQGGNQ